MGEKTLPFKMRGVRSEIQPPNVTMTREQFMSCVEKGLENMEKNVREMQAKGSTRDDILIKSTKKAMEEIRLHAQTVEYAAWGTFHHFFRQEDGEKINCGCPIALISDPLRGSELENHPGLDAKHIVGFVGRYDQEMAEMIGQIVGHRPLHSNAVKVVD